MKKEKLIKLIILRKNPPKILNTDKKNMQNHIQNEISLVYITDWILFQDLPNEYIFQNQLSISKIVMLVTNSAAVLPNKIPSFSHYYFEQNSPKQRKY